MPPAFARVAHPGGVAVPTAQRVYRPGPPTGPASSRHATGGS